jgi:hypothetical protein|tara:strand:- start:12830 stop:13096 length:267 start_codon:yes stop_codon:yes gene_type:complete
MARTLVLGPQSNCPTTVGTASSFSQATVVRLCNTNGSAQLVTILDENFQGIGSMTMPAGSVEYVEKKHQELILAASADVKGTKVGFTA